MDNILNKYNIDKNFTACIYSVDIFDYYNKKIYLNILL